MFRIGEFSKIAQVAGSQLRYYDEIGLLKPAKIDKWTGYRYYSARQLPRLNRILALRDLGLSLDQIKRMLDDDISAEEIHGMFALKKAQIEQTIREELTRLQNIEARLQMINEGEFPEEYDIVVKSVPELSYLSLRDVFPSFDTARLTMTEMLRALPKAVGQKSLGPFTAILHSEMFDVGDLDIEMGFVASEPFDGHMTLPSERTVRWRTLPAVETMITAVRVGLPQTAHPCRAALATWIETSGYQLDGAGREVFIVPPQPGREAETVLEIQYPITKDDVTLLTA